METPKKMSAPRFPVPPGFRLLEAGEIIQEGDLFDCTGQGWIDTSDSGHVYNSNRFSLHYIRPLPPAEVPAPVEPPLDQIRRCNFRDEHGHPLENNVGFIALIGGRSDAFLSGYAAGFSDGESRDGSGDAERVAALARFMATPAGVLGTEGGGK